MKRRDFLLGPPAAAACGCSRRPAAPYKLRAVASRTLFNAGFFTAQEMGFFQQAGVEVELMPHLSRGRDAIPLLGGGEVDVSSYPISAASINAIAKGVKMRIVAGRGMQTPDCGVLGRLYCRKDSFPQGLTDLRMLRGKRISSSSRGGIAEFFIDQILASVGLSTDDLQVRPLQRQEAVVALLNGGLDAVLEYEAVGKLTDVSSAVFAGLDVGAILPNFQFTYLYFGKRLLEGDPHYGARFLGGYMRGIRAYLGGANPKWLSDYAKEFDLDEAAVRGECRRYLTANAEIDMTSLTRFLEWTIKKGYCPASLTAQQLVNRGFLDRAWQQVGRQA
jgi:NitT/TauT family transport system substrate-binding protein